MTDSVWKVGTRASALARAQTGQVRAELKRLHPEHDFVEVLVSSAGDRDRTTALVDLAGEGVFVKELEDALRGRRVDVAVHSLKDVPGRLADGCVLAAVPTRVDPRDVLVSTGPSLAELPGGARVGTGSPRRVAQLLALRPDLRIEPLRGNLETRLGRVHTGDFDGVVVAAAGMQRLGVVPPHTHPFDPADMVPAFGQGFLAIEVRADEPDLIELIGIVEDPLARACADLERTLMATLGGGCRAAQGGLVRPAPAGVHVMLAVGDPLRGRVRRVAWEGSWSDAPEACSELAIRLAATAVTWTS